MGVFASLVENNFITRIAMVVTADEMVKVSVH